VIDRLMQGHRSRHHNAGQRRDGMAIAWSRFGEGFPFRYW
jgi:hypothetical protein